MVDSRELVQQLYLIADELRSSATLARHFAADVYERERGDQIARIAARLASLVDPAPQGVIEELFLDDSLARVSPAVAVEAVVTDARGDLLLCQRRDNRKWCLPGGLAEVGESSSDAALRELWEEAGLKGEVVRLLGAFDGPLWGSKSKLHLVHLVYEVECDSPEPTPGVEMLETRFFRADDLPTAMHPGHESRVPLCFELVRDGVAHHDSASTIGRIMPMYQRPDA